MGRKRDKVIPLYLTDNELKRLDELTAETHCKNRNEFIRKCLINGGNIFCVETEPLYRQLENVAGEFNKIGVNINQLARRINSTGSVYRNDIQDILDAQRSMQQLLKQDLSALDRLSDLV